MFSDTPNIVNLNFLVTSFSTSVFEGVPPVSPCLHHSVPYKPLSFIQTTSCIPLDFFVLNISANSCVKSLGFYGVPPLHTNWTLLFFGICPDRATKYGH